VLTATGLRIFLIVTYLLLLGWRPSHHIYWALICWRYDTWRAPGFCSALVQIRAYLRHASILAVRADADLHSVTCVYLSLACKATLELGRH